MGVKFLASTGSLTAARLFTAVSQLLILPILARYLTTAEFGAIALATTLVMFAQLFSDAGLSRSLVRQPNYDPVEWSSVFWLLCAIGAGLAVCVLALAPIWAWIYAAPEQGQLVAALSVTPLLLSLAAVPNAQLEREDRFQVLAFIRASAAILALLVAVWAAVRGFGVWSLVLQQITLVLVQCTASFWFSGYRPMSPGLRSSLREHLIFARNSLGVSLLQTLQRQLPLMLLGHQLGASTLGLYSMSQRLLLQPTQALAGPASQVTFVRMANVQSEPDRLAALYIGSIRLLALAVFPPMAVLAGAGGDLFAFVFSEPWRPVGLLFALAAPGFAIEAAVSIAGVMFQAVGATGLRLKMVIERTILRILALAVAVPFGIEAVAASISIFALLYLPRYWGFARQAVPFSRRAAATALMVPAGIALALGACAGVLYPFFTSDWSGLVAMLGLIAVGWMLAVGLQWRNLRRSLADFAQ